MDRRKFLEISGGAAAAIPFLNMTQQKTQEKAQKITGAKPRNVVFILSDDHRYDFMSFMGKPSFLKTPGLDRMAHEGAHLKNAFVTTSLCSPSRASILTGMYSHKHGVVDNDSPMRNGLTFFPQYLQQSGYKTAFIGKWHMGNEDDSPRPGFDHWISFRGQGVYYDPVFNIDGKKVERKGYTTDLLTDYAVDWLQENSKNPFFLYLSHKAVHAMFEPAERHKGVYENETPEYPPSMADTKENYKDKPRWVKAQRNSWHGVDFMYQGQMEFDPFYKRYCETLLSLDESVAKVIDTLDDLGLGESTLVVYMGDNGFCLGEHGLIDKRQMYEESIRVPLLARCPELIKPDSVVEKQVQNIDIAPTIMEACGLETPSQMDGLSFIPLLRDQDVPWRDALFYEYFWERPFPQTPTVFGIRTDKWKYMHFHGIWDIDELYDMENDPHEMHNLIKLPEHKDLIQKLNDRIFGWLGKTGGMQIPLHNITLWQANKRKGEE